MKINKRIENKTEAKEKKINGNNKKQKKVTNN